MFVFKSDGQRRLFDAVVSELPALGYDPNLTIADYEYTDFFDPADLRRKIPLAAFGQSPPSYESACLGVVISNGKSGIDLISDCRALGASLAFEIREKDIAAWRVGSKPSPEDERRVIQPPDIRITFARYSGEWSAESILRGKNIDRGLGGARQLDFYDLGLIPALESQIREKLHRMLNDVLAGALKVYGKEWDSLSLAEAQGLFRLTFRFLAAKVLHDRGEGEFASFTGDSNASDVLKKVESYYGQSEPVLNNKNVKDAVFSILWGKLSFQNLSVDVLAYIYEHAFVTKPLRKKLGIHGTPSTIARYIINRLPIEDLPEEGRKFLEPCSGHGIFLVAALHRLRMASQVRRSSEEQHRYFVDMIQGFEVDSFSREVSWLCLMLADFPNHNGWRLEIEDVFLSSAFRTAVEEAKVVVCNPPFENFTPAEQKRYAPLLSKSKPVELLHRVLDGLHPQGMIGFVLPYTFLQGVEYREIRRKLAARYGHLEIVGLPKNNVFFVSQHRSALVIGHKPTAGNGKVTISYKIIDKTDREPFLSGFSITREDKETRTVEEAARSFAIPPLVEVWKYLKSAPKLKNVAKVHRGIEWQSSVPDSERRSDELGEGYEPGFWSAAETDLAAFVPPESCYLLTAKESLRRGINHAWGHRKVFVNAVERVRKGWRHVAFLDYHGFYCTQNFHAIWPRDSETSIEYLAAILNNPVAVAFVSCHSTGMHNNKSTIDAIPLPTHTASEQAAITLLVRQYLTDLDGARKSSLFEPRSVYDTLLGIDALVLKGYGLSAELIKKVTGYLESYTRPVPVKYKMTDLESFIEISSYGIERETTVAWNATHDRRAFLIKKEMSNGLDAGEKRELEGLQSAADRYLDRFEPLPVEDLSWLEERVRQLKLEAEQ